jgi:rare lipoprotein A
LSWEPFLSAREPTQNARRRKINPSHSLIGGPHHLASYEHLAHIAICLCLAVFVAACATQTEPERESIALPAAPPAAAPLAAVPPAPLAAPPVARAKRSKIVMASYQGRGTAGRLTATGELYNPDKLTAASRTLPMGSTIKVTSLATGRSVNVRINDRGPFVHGRSLDLSKRAAERIGITDGGVGRVRITRVSSHPVPTEPDSPSLVGVPTPP